MTKEEFESKLKSKLSENPNWQSLGNTLMLLGIKKQEVAELYNLSKFANMGKIFANIPFVELNERNDQIRLKSVQSTNISQSRANTGVKSAVKTTQNSRSAQIKTILEYLNQNLYGKEEAVRLALLSAVANESIFFMGPPGTAKSMISRRIAAAFSDFYKDGKFTTENGGYFEYLMNEFSTPDEICGPVDLSALNETPSRYVRQTKGYLPSANVAFLDEIWKSGPAILNTLLTIINEKKFHNGSKVENVPLVSLAAASNELPEKDRGLEALWDRFVLRVFVNPVENEDDFFKVVDDGNKNFAPTEQITSLLKIDDVASWQTEIDKVTLSDEAKKVISAIKKELALLNTDEKHKDDEAYYVSDRRWKKIVHILKTSAFLNGRDAVDLMDCSLIEYAIWNTDKQHDEVGGIIEKILKQFGISFDNNTQKIENDIKAFDEYVDKQFYINSGNKLEKDSNVFDTPDLLKLRSDKADSEWYERISAEIKDSLKEIDDFKTKQEEPFKQNHFAAQKYCDVIMSAVKAASEQHENLKIELDKVKDRYSSEKNVPQSSSATEKVQLNYSAMIAVGGGTFERKARWDEEGDEEVRLADEYFNITVNSFEIGKFPVTQRLYEEVMGSNPSQFKGKNRPVEYVSWYDAVKFCNALSEKDGLEPCYSEDDWECDFSANGYRLPTEAEWEFAARGGNQSDEFKYSGSDDLDEVGWSNDEDNDIYINETQSVGQKKPNELGIYDMSGNVWEWCNDWYDGNYYEQDDQTNPHGAWSGYGRVRRGGSWEDDSSVCGVYYRSYCSPDDADGCMGFRIVRSGKKKKRI